METRAHHVIIGLFVISAFAGIVLFSLWLGKSSAEREFGYYDIVFNEEVSGLTPGSPVEYSGIKVGDVDTLQLAPDDPRKVIARVRLSASTPVKKDTHARLALANISGSALIRLFGGSPGSPSLQASEEFIPVIIADPSPISRFLANGESLMADLNSLVTNANRLLSEDNIKNLSKMLNNAEQVTGIVATQKTELSDTLHQLNLLSKQANRAMQDISALAANANGLLTSHGRQALDNAARSMTTLEQTTRRIDQLLAKNKGPLQNGLQSLNDLGPALQELRIALATLNRLSRRIEEDPSGFLLDREKNKEFQP